MTLGEKVYNRVCEQKLVFVDSSVKKLLLKSDQLVLWIANLAVIKVTAQIAQLVQLRSLRSWCKYPKRFVRLRKILEFLKHQCIGS